MRDSQLSDGDPLHASRSRPHVPVSRRVFLRTAASGTAGMAAWSLLSARGPAASAAERAGRLPAIQRRDHRPPAARGQRARRDAGFHLQP